MFKSSVKVIFARNLIHFGQVRLKQLRVLDPSNSKKDLLNRNGKPDETCVGYTSLSIVSRDCRSCGYLNTSEINGQAIYENSKSQDEKIHVSITNDRTTAPTQSRLREHSVKIHEALSVRH